MRFLFPGFLFALLAVAIPIIIHLFNFRKFKRVYFSNVRFLKNIQQQTSSHRRIKHLLILAARVLAIIFLVFAFARPYIPDKNSAGTSSQQLVSIYIDNSYSMETVNKEGSLLDEARRRAREIAAAYNLNDKFQLLTNDFEGRHQRLLNYEDFVREVEEVKSSSADKNLNEVINRQEEVFSSEPNAQKNLYLISDFQKNKGTAEVVRSDKKLNIRLVSLKANALPNISVDSVWFASPIHKPGQSEQLLVKLRNNSDEKAVNVPIKLYINQKQKAIGNLSIEARATRTDTLTFNGINKGWQSGEINITDFPVIFDDKFYFSFNVQGNLKILAINGNNSNPYLRAVYRSDPYFNLEEVSSGNINYSALNNYSLIVLNEVSEYSTGLIRQLKDYTQKGGSLLVFPSGDKVDGLKTMLQSMQTDLPLEMVSAEGRVSSINLKNPVFSGVFDRLPQNIDLPVARKFIRYSSQSRSSKQSLLEFTGGGGFFNDYTLGKGKIYLSAVPLNDEASNFPRHSIFVPLMYQVAMLSLQNQQHFYTLGRDQSIEIPKITLNANQTLKLRKPNFETIPDTRQAENNTQLYIADQIKEAGTYELIKADSLLSYLAFNNSGSESDLTYLKDDELLSKFKGTKPRIINSAEGSVQNAVKSADQGMALWKLCIILALMCLAAEILLIRFYKSSAVKSLSIT